ncbi:ABC transporter substrate-binding protein [Poseidonocella sp. HB161398]|uniref:ABC transporter substrate-binding protein n=1 Tax=Poseidonocella sp. HB161398 TaxID=2320855 RepID=UPI00110810BC|nr:ABC transporter substrate-binding protein [Poseidonocella sp. HB161398]
MSQSRRPAALPRSLLGELGRDWRTGGMDRREFLARATALGVSAAALGAPGPGRAQEAPGSGLRIQMRVLPQGDPRLWDFTEKYNACAGLLDTLVHADPDGRLSGRLLESWETAEDAASCTLHLRPDVTWSNGDAFTAEDVLANFEGWCDSRLAGNSMASRLASLVDPGTGGLRAGAVSIVDPLTVRLELGFPDITLLPGLSDYPAVVMHRSAIGEDPLERQIGTGAYRIAEYSPGARAVLERDPARSPWRPGRVDRIEFVDLGPDPAAVAAAAEAGQIDVTYDTIGAYVSVLDGIGWTRSEIDTSATIVLRASQTHEMGGFRPYGDLRVRQALQLAVDNQVLLELGYDGRGTVAENHHVSPLHPAYARIAPPRQDVAAAQRLMDEAGLLEYEHELVSIDDDWRRFTTDVMAAQLRDAGFKVKRVILPASEYNAGWKDFAFSSTNWNARELGVQVLDLAYRSGAAWNETGFADPEFDALLDRAKGLPGVEERREVMAGLQQKLRDQAVIVQPYWRRLMRHYRPGVTGAERTHKDMIDLHELARAG